MAEKGYVFISYSTRDSLFVKQLTDAMNANRISYWKAPEMIPAGSNYAREIPKAINGCDVFLLVLSQKSQDSIWVEKEIDVAICNHKKVIPIVIDETPLNDMYRFYLNNVQMVYIPVNNKTQDNQLIYSESTLHNEIKERVLKVLMENTQDNIPDDIQDSTKECQRFSISRNLPKQKVADRRSNALRINRIPISCEFCGGKVSQTSLGVYRCDLCKKENYDDFQKVRNYLNQVGNAPIRMIAKNTGVSVQTIEYFWNHDYLRDIKGIIKK